MQIDKKQPLCSICGSIAAMTDAAGLLWCEEHRFRGDLLTWAVQHGYPGIQVQGEQKYAIGVAGSSDNQDLWIVAVVLGNDDAIWTALSYVMEHEAA